MAGIHGLLHDNDLVELKNLYIHIKKNNIQEFERQKRLYENMGKKYWSDSYIPTSTENIIRQIIISKLTNELYFDYLEIYGEVNPNSRTTDFTTYMDYKLIEYNANELDLTDFFIMNNYNHRENYNQEEIDAEIDYGGDEAKEIWNKELAFQLEQERLEILKNKKNGV